MTVEEEEYQDVLLRLREHVHRDVLPLETFQQRWEKLRRLIIEYKLGSEEFCLLANDITLFPPENEV